MTMQTGLYRTAAKASLYFFLASGALLLFFVLGNLQDFLESTLYLLLDCLEWTLVVFLAAHIVFVLSAFFSRAAMRRLRGRMLLPAILGFLYGGALLLALNLLTAWLHYE
jgi:hypothetical protein